MPSALWRRRDGKGALPLRVDRALSQLCCIPGPQWWSLHHLPSAPGPAEGLVAGASSTPWVTMPTASIWCGGQGLLLLVPAGMG